MSPNQNPQLTQAIAHGDQFRRQRNWHAAQAFYALAQRFSPDPTSSSHALSLAHSLAHNLALCHLSLDEHDHALTQARLARRLSQTLPWENPRLSTELLLARTLQACSMAQEARDVLIHAHQSISSLDGLDHFNPLFGHLRVALAKSLDGVVPHFWPQEGRNPTTPRGLFQDVLNTYERLKNEYAHGAHGRSLIEQYQDIASDAAVGLLTLDLFDPNHDESGGIAKGATDLWSPARLSATPSLVTDANLISQRIMSIASEHLTLAPRLIGPDQPQPHLDSERPLHTANTNRPRIGILGAQFSASPLYFLTFSILKSLSRHVQLVILDRGTSPKSDWARQDFKELVGQGNWIHVSGMDSASLHQTIRQSHLHALIDCCGWSDPVALKALSVKSCSKLYKWVGGQSCTTGLNSFDGYLTDDHQSPPGSQALHSEPLIHLQHGYCGYTPPPYMPSARPFGDPGHASDSTSRLGIICNPSKLSSSFIQWLASRSYDWAQSRHDHGLGAATLVFIDRRYEDDDLRADVLRRLAKISHPEARRRIPLLGQTKTIDGLALSVQFCAPSTHLQYLQDVKSLHAVVDTWPFSAGLTALEALHLGVPILCRTDGALFSQRHAVAHSLNVGPNQIPDDQQNKQPSAVCYDLAEFNGICPPSHGNLYCQRLADKNKAVADQIKQLLLN